MDYTHRVGREPNYLVAPLRANANTNPRDRFMEPYKRRCENIDPWYARAPGAVGFTVGHIADDPEQLRNADVDHLYNIDFLRRRWGWMFEEWDVYGLSEVRELILVLHGFERDEGWAKHWRILDRLDYWEYPVRDLFFWLFKVPAHVTSFRIIGGSSLWLRLRLQSIETHSPTVPYRRPFDANIDNWMTTWWTDHRNPYFQAGLTWHAALRQRFQLQIGQG